MKVAIKSLFMAVWIAMVFTACSSDELIDTPSGYPSPGDPQDATVSVRLGGILTKSDSKIASGEKEEVPLTPGHEAIVNFCVVAVFEKNGGDPKDDYRIGYKYVMANKVWEDYEVTDVPCKEGDVRIVVIANSGPTPGSSDREHPFGKSRFHDLYTYQDFLDETTALEDSIESVNSLVKSGEKEVHLNPGKNKVTVEVRMLTARIDIDTVRVLPAALGATFEIKNMSADVCSRSHMLFPVAGEYDETPVSTELFFQDWEHDSPTNHPHLPFIYKDEQSTDFYYYFYTYATRKTTLTIEGILTIGSKKERKTFTFDLKDTFERGHIYRYNININTHLDVMNLNHTVLDWEDVEINTSLK